MSAISDSSGLEVVMLPGAAIYCTPPLSLSPLALLREARPVTVPGTIVSHHSTLYNAYRQPASQTDNWCTALYFACYRPNLVKYYL